MTDQPKPENQAEQQNAPKTDVPAKTDAVEATTASQPTQPQETTKAAPAITDEAVKAAPQEKTEPATQPAEASKNEKPAEPVEAPKAPEKPEELNKPASSPAESAKVPVEGAVTRDLSEARNQEPEKPATSEPSIPSPIAAKSETLSGTGPLAGEPKSTQRIPDPESLGISSNIADAGTICPTCGHRNRPGILLCENCGTNLMTGRQSSIGTRDLMREQETGAENKLDAAAQKAIETAGGSTFAEDMVLRIEIEGGSTPMLVYPKQEIIMGRRDPNTGGMPDVDLTAYAGYRMGVSRRHAAIRLQDKQLNVSDLGSSNGTFLNGTRLNAHRPYPLRDGDEVRLGQMVLRLYFQSNKERK